MILTRKKGKEDYDMMMEATLFIFKVFFKKIQAKEKRILLFFFLVFDFVFLIVMIYS